MARSWLSGTQQHLNLGLARVRICREVARECGFQQFQFMKADIEPLLERTKALMPELIELNILVTIPRWAVERQKGVF